jgi:RimJ/RimL family protein N-acetyltransferase
MRFYGNGQALDDAQINLVLDAHVHCRHRAYWAWAVTLKGDDKNECFGQVTAGAVEWNGEQWIELCWLLTPKNWRKGFGTEAVKAVIDHGISDLGWQKVMAGSDIRNEASLRMMSKCGMTYTREELDSHKRMRRIHTLTCVPGQANPSSQIIATAR